MNGVVGVLVVPPATGAAIFFAHKPGATVLAIGQNTYLPSTDRSPMPKHAIRWMFALVFASCATTQPGSATSDPLDGERTVLSEKECKTRGGNVVGDIGDGATHRSDYVCASGKAPLGDIAPPETGPIPVEGAVCCPR